MTSVKRAVLVARLLHDDLAVLLEDLGLDLAGLAVDELAEARACRRGWRCAPPSRSAGQSESVLRGQPSCGNVRSRRLSSGAGAHSGLSDGRSNLAL